MVAEADLSSVTVTADKILRIDGRAPMIAHLEFQSGADSALNARVLVYNVLTWRREQIPVVSVVFLLRPAALRRAMTGRVSYTGVAGCQLDFADRLVRVWELPVEPLLAGGLGTLPLAPIAAVSPANLANVFRKMAGRLDREVSAARADELWTASFILSGLRYPSALIEPLM